MCQAGVALLTETWEDGAARVGRLDDGSVVSLSFVRDAAPGACVLVHLGVPVEVLDATNAHDMLALRQNTESEEEEVHP